MKSTAPRLFIVDVFAERAYAGNPLAVVIGADGFSDEAMQRFAAEMNFSETSFVGRAPGADGGFRARIFTPSREIAFAGHPILGTAWVVRHGIAPGNPAPVRLNLSVGQVPVHFEADGRGAETAWFLAPPVTRGPTCARERIAPALGISAEDIESRFPVQQLASGTAAMIVPLRGLDALGRSRLDMAAFAPLAAEGFPPLVYLFCTQTRDSGNDLCARFFFDSHGVREDPATGNGAAFLGAYLLEHKVFPASASSWRIEQGYEVRRPSVVRLRARMVASAPEIQVGGKVIATVQGELL